MRDNTIQSGDATLQDHTHDTLDISSASLGKSDAFLLLIMWLIVAVCSLHNLGRVPGYIFLLLNLVVALRSPVSGLIVLVILSFTPSITLLLPRVMVLSSVVLGFSCLIRGTVRHIPVFNRLILMILAFMSIAGISVLFCPDIAVGWHRYNSYIEGLILATFVCMILRTRPDLGRFLKWVGISAALAAPLGVAHYMYGKSAATYTMLRALRGRESVDAALAISAGGDSARLLWAGAEGNYFAACLVFPLAVCLGLVAVRPRLSQKAFWAVAVGLVIVASIGTCSRSSMLVTGGVTLAFVGRRNVRALLPLLFISVVGVAAMRMIPAAWTRLQTVPSGITETGASGRFEMYRRTIRMGMSQPLWGNGLGAVWTRTGDAAHNTFLETFADTGMIGITCYVGIIVLAIRALRRTVALLGGRKYGDGAFCDILMIGVLGMCLHLCTITLYSPQLLWAFCGACVAAADVYGRASLWEAGADDAAGGGWQSRT